MITLTSLDSVEKFIRDHQFSFLYVSRTNCGVCHVILPQLIDLLEEFPLIQLGHINADDLEEIAGRFSIFTVPVLLLFVDGKEVIREARFVHMQSLHEKISKIYNMMVEKLD
ncbi:thioredoxin family protein [Lederbergia lenta]|uniref:Cytochrome c heme-binding site n=1 Tax=Lederbergia lenta TaxID=1467 RepID=A0A2X4WQ46_LEDLE|nr:thioredoxin family protein [Lederbergia lenta]MCM3109765.1 thioredoxin family protein [Lederbergia lenta]MEC2324485.1 thioredoxin family protein [Lederbergia lenta]SQI59790.1 cytochrome c heme-binding site [Lederbergia lenta]